MVKPVILTWILLPALAAAGCSGRGNIQETDVSNMRIDSNGKIIISAAVDTSVFDMLLDTGGGEAVFISDSVASVLNLHTGRKESVNIMYGFDPEPLNRPSKVRVDTALQISVGGREILYDRIIINNDVLNYGADCILPVRSVSPAVWNIDFDANTVTVGDSPDIGNADYAFELGYDENAGNYYVSDFPLSFRSQTDSLHYTASYFVDTGSPYGISILGGGGPDGRYGELKRFLEKNAFGFSYRHSYSSGPISDDMFYVKEDMMTGDTLEIMLREKSGLSTKILGMDFLYRFNIALDIPGSRIYMARRKGQVPIDEFVLEQEKALMDTYSADDGTRVISSINKKSWLYKAGLRRFDKIVKINGQHSMKVRSSYLRELEDGEKVVFDIIRKGRNLRITAEKTAFSSTGTNIVT